MSNKATIEVSGRVKWFDPAKGFGFLVCPELDADVMVHNSVLRELGRRAVPEGTELVVEAFKSDRGYQVEKVISIDLRGALPPRRRTASTKATSQPHGEAGEFEPVVVKWFSELKGYGFLIRGDDDVFVHAGHLRRAGLVPPADGEFLEARVAHGEKGLIAVEVRAAQEPQAIAA
jgi:CspA family cold shock protein